MKKVLSTAFAAAFMALVVFAGTPASAVQSTNFDGIVALSNCSGAVIRWSSSVATDAAVVLTNAHCYQLLGAHEVVVDQPSVRDVTLLKSNGDFAGSVKTTKLLYATLWQTDVALYKVGLTYKQLIKHYGVHAITLASAQTIAKHQPISVVSGYFTVEYDCHMNGFAYRLHEDIYTWRESLRYEDGGCPVIGGTSGSPVLNADRLEIGINNTINADGQRCTLNNPCEENRKGVTTVHQGRGYAQETWMFYTCLSDNQLDLAKSGCELPTP